VDRFVAACEGNDIDTVRQRIERGHDINGRKPNGSWHGFTGLMMAMYRNNVAIVRMLLASESVNLAMRDNGRTALHWGCCGGSVESVRLFLAHPQCNQEIVRMVDNHGYTAEMLATMHGESQECERLVREYPDANVETAGAGAAHASTSQPQESALSLGQLAEALAIVEREEAERKSRKEALAEALAKEEREEAELKSRKDALTATLMERARSQSSLLVPECPVCLVKMAPPLQIFNCSNGHLICSLCKPRIAGNLCVTLCQGSYTGRATAVEQIVRNTLGIE